MRHECGHAHGGVQCVQTLMNACSVSVDTLIKVYSVSLDTHGVQHECGHAHGGVQCVETVMNACSMSVDTHDGVQCGHTNSVPSAVERDAPRHAAPLHNASSRSPALRSTAPCITDT